MIKASILLPLIKLRITVVLCLDSGVGILFRRVSRNRPNLRSYQYQCSAGRALSRIPLGAYSAPQMMMMRVCPHLRSLGVYSYNTDDGGIFQ